MYILYNSNYMAFWKRQNYKGSNISVVFRLVIAWIGGTQGNFRAEKLFYWAGHTVHLGFSIRRNEKTRRNCLANPIYNTVMMHT